MTVKRAGLGARSYAFNAALETQPPGLPQEPPPVAPTEAAQPAVPAASPLLVSAGLLKAQAEFLENIASCRDPADLIRHQATLLRATWRLFVGLPPR